jgi:hypothetical protein
MTSGRKERVVISCVTFDVAKIVSPILYYEASRAHLIHYAKTDVYKDFYDEVCKRIGESMPKCEIVEHEAEVFDFSRMMNIVSGIMEKEMSTEGTCPDIYVNVSAGTSEYSAASLMASMMHDGVMPFNVPTEKYTVSTDMIKEIYYSEGRPAGLSLTVKEPKLISTFSMEMPDRGQVIGLGIIKRRLEKKEPISAAAVIPELDDLGLIKCTNTPGTNKPNQNTLMNYQRNFVDKWIANGWAERISKRGMRITPDGEAVLKMFLDL